MAFDPPRFPKSPISKSGGVIFSGALTPNDNNLFLKLAWVFVYFFTKIDSILFYTSHLLWSFLTISFYWFKNSLDLSRDLIGVTSDPCLHAPSTSSSSTHTTYLIYLLLRVIFNVTTNYSIPMSRALPFNLSMRYG